MQTSDISFLSSRSLSQAQEESAERLDSMLVVKFRWKQVTSMV